MQQKLLLLFAGGVAPSSARTPRAQWKVIQEMGKEWKAVDHERTSRAVSLTLGEDGRKRVLTYNLGLHISSHRWDRFTQVQPLSRFEVKPACTDLPCGAV